ncbi:hypothetical protein [Serratia fonticola]|uniref:hypothetical protein n=1 Tax=Serratia fonticola TaxID=47917 RepID=UPI003BB4F908
MINIDKKDEINDCQQAALWRQRFFEAEAGLNKYLVEQKGGAFLGLWVQVKKNIYANVPTELEASAWKNAFFCAQAMMEEFVIEQFGYDELKQWAKSNATVYGIVEHPRAPGPEGPLERLRQQLELYGSEVEFTKLDEHEAELKIQRCGIWQYREEARARGVVITLESPCEYCTASTSANISAKGFKPDFELMVTNNIHGCRWYVQKNHKI